MTKTGVKDKTAHMVVYEIGTSGLCTPRWHVHYALRPLRTKRTTTVSERKDFSLEIFKLVLRTGCAEAGRPFAVCGKVCSNSL